MSARGPMVHELKCVNPSFWDIKRGLKTFEARRADRDFRVDDVLRLKEYAPVSGAFSGDSIERRITYVLTGEEFGILPGFCVLALAE